MTPSGGEGALNRRLSSLVLGGLTLSSLYVGGWATAAPRSFYHSFPGFNRAWIRADGPYNEHLIRDVGAMYLALGALCVGAIVCNDERVRRLAGLVWTTFSLPHLLYHLAHPADQGYADQVATGVTLSLTLLGALYLMIPLRR